MWNAKTQKVCLAVWQETEWATLPISCLRLPQPSLTSLPSLPVRHSQTKAPGSATPQLFRGHGRKHRLPSSLGPQVLFFWEEMCSAAFSTSTLNSEWGFLIHLGMSRMAGPASNCFDSQEQCQLCLGEHRLHFHVNHPAKYNKNASEA